jgi:hypothetical protein
VGREFAGHHTHRRPNRHASGLGGRKARWIFVGAAALLVLITVIAAVVMRPSHPSTSASGQSVLPFIGLYQSQGLAVDSTGAIYVADFNNLLKLAAWSNKQMVLPFAGLNYSEGVAVDAQGGVYVADRANNRVVRLKAGSSGHDELPFTGGDAGQRRVCVCRRPRQQQGGTAGGEGVTRCSRSPRTAAPRYPERRRTTGQ